MAGESETIAKTYGVARVTIARLQHRFHRTLKWDRRDGGRRWFSGTVTSTRSGGGVSRSLAKPSASAACPLGHVNTSPRYRIAGLALLRGVACPLRLISTHCAISTLCVRGSGP